MPLLTDQRHPIPEVASETSNGLTSSGVSHAEPRQGRADAPDRSEGSDPSNDSDDIAGWYPRFLSALLAGMLGLGGLWVWNFAI